MKQLITRLFPILALLLLPMVASAQAGTPAHDPGQRQTEWMKDHLSLTDAQLPVVQEINQRYAGKMKDLAATDEPRRQKAKELRALSRQKNDELKNVLTPEQFQTWQESRKELRQKAVKHARKQHQAEGAGTGSAE